MKKITAAAEKGEPVGMAGGGSKEGSDVSSDDDDVIGPPLPPGYSGRGLQSEKSTEEREEDMESGEEDEEDDSVSPFAINISIKNIFFDVCFFRISCVDFHCRTR